MTIQGYAPQITANTAERRLRLLHGGNEVSTDFILASSIPNDYIPDVLPFVEAVDYNDPDGDVAAIHAIEVISGTLAVKWSYYDNVTHTWQPFSLTQMGQSFIHSSLLGADLQVIVSAQARAISQFGDPRQGPLQQLSKTYTINAYEVFADLMTFNDKDFSGHTIANIPINVGFPYTGFLDASFYLNIPSGFGSRTDYNWRVTTTHANVDNSGGADTGRVSLVSKGPATIIAEGKSGTPASGKALAYSVNPEKWYFTVNNGFVVLWYDTVSGRYLVREACAAGGGRVPVRKELSNSPYADPVAYPSATASSWIPSAFNDVATRVVSNASQFSLAQDWGDTAPYMGVTQSLPTGGLSVFIDETVDNVPDNSNVASHLRFMYKNTDGGVLHTRGVNYSSGVICLMD